MKKKKVIDIGFGYMDKNGEIYNDEMDLALHYMTKKQYSEWYKVGYKEGNTGYNSYLDKWIKSWEIVKPEDVEETFEILIEWGII